MKLKKPIEFLTKTYDEIKFREPRGIDLAECGVPFKGAGSLMDKKSGRLDSQSIHNLMVSLSDVPEEVIAMLSVKDWIDCSAEVMGFFADTEPATPS